MNFKDDIINEVNRQLEHRKKNNLIMFIGNIEVRDEND